MKAKNYWKDSFRLEGVTESGHTVLMDSVPKETPSSGPTPKELILQALAGCTMMNVISILQKARKKILKFWVEIDSDISDEIPHAFKINLNYNFIADDLSEHLAINAIKLSLDKHCSVGAMLKGNVEIIYSYKIMKSSKLEYAQNANPTA